MNPAVDGAARQGLRRRSKVLFGNADRLEVVDAVGRSSGGVVHAQELSNELGISPPRVRAQLLALVEAGLLVSLPRHGSVQNYERVDDIFWESVCAVVADWSDG